jgi:hypothetical protein
MQAIDRPFVKIINGTSQFVIPVFQRDYSWEEAECEQPWKDILQIGADPTDRRHFLGSVVYVPTGDTSASFTRWLLIDGQQRVTTLTLLLIALRNHIRESGWTGTEHGPTAKRVEAYFLKNVQEEGDREHKLVLRRHDQATLEALLDGHELPAQASERIRENYEFFRGQLSNADPERVYNGIGRLVVVDVTLDRVTDDPQLIFESLNSTGMDLSQSDLIRNFILMRLPEREQTRLYETYWTKIENLFRGSERTFDAFVRDFIALRTKASKQEKADEIYFAFRRHFRCDRIRAYRSRCLPRRTASLRQISRGIQLGCRGTGTSARAVGPASTPCGRSRATGDATLRVPGPPPNTERIGLRASARPARELRLPPRDLRRADARLLAGVRQPRVSDRLRATLREPDGRPRTTPRELPISD